ncbi:MAG: ribonuclease III [bacterium]|nr:ribonuclease III [bacterium]
MSDFSQLESTLGMEFKDAALLEQAFVHRSYLNENPGFRLEHNERLEFLGDAVIELVVTAHLYRNYPNPEGELTNFRAALVNFQMLGSLAKDLDFNDYLLLSRGEMQDTGRAREVILANTFEAVVGAMYLDGGYAPAEAFIERVLLAKLPTIVAQGKHRDAKSLFQEEAQERMKITPTYKVLDEWGPDHAKHFRMGVFLNEELVAEGEGASKQEAEAEAAKEGLRVKGWR